MRTRRFWLLWAMLAGIPFATGCGDTAPAEQDENLIAPAGKEDNFFSNVAQEFLVTADVKIVLAESYREKTADERQARAREVMDGRTRQIGWFLHVYLVDKSREDEAKHYGGLRAMVLDGSYETTGLKADPEDELTFSYTFKVQIGGAKQLLRLIREEQGLGATEDVFTLKLAKLDNDKVANFSHSKYEAGEWAPDSCDCEVEDLAMKIAPIEPSNDAYPDLAAFMDDGVIDIGVHFGWDYHARYDLQHAGNFYRWLVDQGYKSPVGGYQQYHRLSGPLTKTIRVNGREILVKVAIFRSDPCEAFSEAGHWGSWSKEMEKDKNYKKRACPDFGWAEPEAVSNPTTVDGARRLVEDLEHSLQTRDVIIFSGHSGYTYAYAMASWYKTLVGEITPEDILALDLPRDKSQLFAIQGCDTYHVGQAFKDNPAKKGLHNADVITSTSFSNSTDLSDTQDIVRAVAGNADGLVAQSYAHLMSKMNNSGWLPYNKFSFFTMYGVHGIDDNPKRNPLGNSEMHCLSCDTDKECGASGNVCVRLNDDEKVCAVGCVHDDGCAEGQVCRRFGSSNSFSLKGRACVPKSLSCKVAPIDNPTVKEFSAEGSVKRKEERHFKVRVGPMARNIKVELTGTNDADLYADLAAEPSDSRFSCRPYTGTSQESCSFASVSGDTLYLMVRGFAAGSNFKLLVTWD